MSAPERIWLDHPFRELFLPGEERYGIEGLTEYVRVDLHTALLDDRDRLAAEVERLKGALTNLVSLYPYEAEDMGLVSAAHDVARAALQGD